MLAAGGATHTHTETARETPAGVGAFCSDLFIGEGRRNGVAQVWDPRERCLPKFSPPGCFCTPACIRLAATWVKNKIIIKKKNLPARTPPSNVDLKVLWLVLLGRKRSIFARRCWLGEAGSGRPCGPCHKKGWKDGGALGPCPPWGSSLQQFSLRTPHHGRLVGAAAKSQTLRDSRVCSGVSGGLQTRTKPTPAISSPEWKAPVGWRGLPARYGGSLAPQPAPHLRVKQS